MPRTNDMEREMNEQAEDSEQLSTDAVSGGDARFYAHPSGDGAICRAGRTTRLCLDELLIELNSVADRQPSYVQGSDELRARTDSERAAYMEGLEEGKRIAACQPVGVEPVAPQSIPEGWALVDLSSYAVLPQLPSEQMIGAGWPAGEMISECFDSLGAYADLIASYSANGSGIVHGKGQPAPAAVPVDAAKLAESRGFNGAIRYVLGYFNRTGDRGSTAYEEILNSCGREQIIRSAVEDGELEFTGLGWYVENYGTEQDRNLLATHPQPAAAVPSTGVQAIAEERARQVQVEGMTPEGDAGYRYGQLAWAAVAYLQLSAMELRDGGRAHIATASPPACWPWDASWWKPRDVRRDLVRAGALIAAQLDAIDQQAKPEAQ